MLRAGLIGAGLGLAVSASIAATPLVDFQFNEGSGATTVDSINNLVGTLGVQPDPADDPTVFSSFAPSLAVGDNSISFNEVNTTGEGFLAVDDSNNPILALATNAFTMEAWILIDPNDARAYEGIGAYGSSYKLGLNNQQLIFTLFGVVDIFSGVTIPTGEWHHVAAAWQPGVGVTFFYDGTEVTNIAETAAIPAFQNHYLTIGAETINGNAFMGYIDRFRMESGALTASQLDSNPTTVQPPDANTLVDYNFNESGPPFQSAGTTPRPALPTSQFLPTISAPTFTTDTPTGKSGDYALHFGVGQSVTVADPNTALQFDTNNPSFTLQAWVKFHGADQPTTRSVFFYNNGPGGAISYSIGSDQRVWVTTLGILDIQSSAIVPDDGAWHHITVVHDNGVDMKFYVDGVLEDTIPYTSGVIFTRTDTNFYIGSEPGGGHQYVGSLDRLRVTSGALTPDQFDISQTAHYLVAITPVPGSPAAAPNLIRVVLGQGTNGLDTSSIALALNGASVTPTITQGTNNETVVTYNPSPLLVSGSTNTVALTFKDMASPANSYTNTWSFVVASYPTLNIGMGTAAGSQDTNAPGFRYRIVQTASPNAISTANWENSDAQAEINLAGGLAPYTDPSTFTYSYTAVTSGVPATLTYTPGADGFLAVTNVINFNHNGVAYGGLGGSGDIGDFKAPAFPDYPVPGLPDTPLSDDPAADSVSAEMYTYVAFPTAGFYEMGVNSDDGFRVSEATNQDYPVNLVKVNSPSNMATNMLGIEAQFSPALPQLADVGPITGNVVEAQPMDGSAPLTNPDAIKGNIALIDRGAVTFAEKIGYAEDAGAIAVIVADSSSGGDLIITMGNNGETRNIPAVMINYTSGQALHTALESGQTVNVTLQSHHYTNLGYFDGGRGSSDTLFGFAVPAAGVYPMRLMYYNGGGGANCEWFTVDQNGDKVLLNDLSNPNALKAYRTRSEIPLQPLSASLGVSLSGSTLTFTWSGTGYKLQSTPTLTNPTWTDVANGGSSPATDTVSGGSKFYRLISQ